MRPLPWLTVVLMACSTSRRVAPTPPGELLALHAQDFGADSATLPTRIRSSERCALATGASPGQRRLVWDVRSVVASGESTTRFVDLSIRLADNAGCRVALRPFDGLAPGATHPNPAVTIQRISLNGLRFQQVQVHYEYACSSGSGTAALQLSSSASVPAEEGCTRGPPVVE